MRSGLQRCLVTLKRETAAADTFGQLVTNATATVATLWAGIDPLAGSEGEAARQLRADATHKITLRANTEYTVKPDDYVLYGARRFDVIEARNVEERGRAWELICKEVLAPNLAP